MQNIRRKLVRLLERSAILCLLAMTLSFLLFGLFSVELFLLFSANLNLIKDFGIMALMDGAAMQLLQIFGNALASAVFFVGFKLCERILVEKLMN